MTEIGEVAERVAARRAELDEEEKLLVEQLEKVRSEREDLAGAMRVWERMHAQLQTEKAATQAVPAQVGGRGVLLVPHQEAGVGEDAPPPDYQRIMQIVREARYASKTSAPCSASKSRSRGGWSRCAAS